MSLAQSRQDILRRVRAALHSEPRLGPKYRPERLEIDDDGTLTIEGEVPSVAAKKLALERIAAVEEVTGIIDRLHVEPAEPIHQAGFDHRAGQHED